MWNFSSGKCEFGDYLCWFLHRDSSERSLKEVKCNTDMQKVEILPPADFQVKISAKGQNQTLLLGFMNFRQFS